MPAFQTKASLDMAEKQKSVSSTQKKIKQQVELVLSGPRQALQSTYYQNI